MQPNMLGAYGEWAASLVAEGPGPLSCRLPRWNDLEAWRPVARARVRALLAAPALSAPTDVRLHRRHSHDGLYIEELSWQLAYGPRTQAVFLRPDGAARRLPAVLALHDHGGQKMFGAAKITRVPGEQHPVMLEHQRSYYGGAPWANALARRGYAVLVHDAFAFASRRVLLADVPPAIRGDLSDDDPFALEHIAAYNAWAAGHESILAKSLFCAGTTWPGVFLSEDQAALGVLCSRNDVDPQRVGCGGLSGGGLRTDYLAGLDDRIRCAVSVGLMTTWRDYLLNKSHTHTWMIYIPHLARELDFPEILGLRAPLPTLVQLDSEDQLFTLPEMQRADAMLRAVYDKAAASERYRCSFYPGPHKFDLAMQAEAFEWFDRWLR